MVGWIKTKLRLQVGLDPGHVVLDRYPAPSPQRGIPPIFGPCLLWPNGWVDQWIKMALGMEVGLGPGHTVLDGNQLPSPKRVTAPNFRPISIVAKQLDASRCHLAWM